MRGRINRRRAGIESHCAVYRGKYANGSAAPQILSILVIALFSTLASSAAITAPTPYDLAVSVPRIAHDPGPEAIRAAESGGNSRRADATDARAPASDAGAVKCQEAVVNP
jgi:hypothetical protein